MSMLRHKNLHTSILAAYDDCDDVFFYHDYGDDGGGVLLIRLCYRHDGGGDVLETCLTCGGDGDA